MNDMATDSAYENWLQQPYGALLQSPSASPDVVAEQGGPQATDLMFGGTTATDTSRDTMDILAAVFFVVAGIWLVIAMVYSCMILLFLRMRAAGELDSIYEPDFGRVYFGCGDRFYLPLGCIFRRYLHHLQQEQRTRSESGNQAARYMTTAERRSAMEVLLLESTDKNKGKGKNVGTCRNASASVVDKETADVQVHGDDSSTEEPVCLICFDEFTEPDSVLHSQTCSHDYHKDCIMDWLQRQGTKECPCCRVPMVCEEKVWDIVQQLRKDQRRQQRREKSWFRRIGNNATKEGTEQRETEHSEDSDYDDVIMVSPTDSTDATSQEDEDEVVVDV
jgi:hypothetical protein